VNAVTNYREFRRFRPKTPRERVKDVVLDLLSLFNNNDKNCNDSVVFLAFHFLFDDNEDGFRKLLDQLSLNYSFLTVTEAVHRVINGTLTGRNICFTCDDGFESSLKAAAILEEYGAKCCFFLCPDFIGLTDLERVRFYNQDRLGGPPISFLDWDDIELLQKNGHEIGNHTLGHMNLGKVDNDTMEEQIGSALEVLKKHTGTIRHFACPYGQPNAYTRQAVDFCYQLGHQSFFTTSRGMHVNKSSITNGLFKRHHFEPFWPVRHTEYFLNSKRYRGI